MIEEGAQVTVAEAGLAAFVSPFVSNAGVINAKMGTVAIGAGETVTLDLYGDGLVELAVDGELEDALIENTGTISAEGGSVQISARAAKEAVDNIINVDGVVTASSASVQGGKIVLSGGNSGTVSVKGKVDASGEGGGEIDVTGENIQIADTAELKADGGQNGDGGDIEIIASDKAIFRGSASAKGGSESGKGGFVETSGHGYISVASGSVDTRAADGSAGTWLIDPTNITIVSGSTAASETGGEFTPTSTIGWLDIETALGSNNVLITTASGDLEAGDITFASGGFTGASISDADQSRTLTFNADRDIIVNSDISLSNIGTTTLNAGGSVIFNEDFKTTDNTSLDPTISGNLAVNADHDIFVNSGSLVGVVGSGFGDVTFTAMNNNGGLSAIEIDGTVQTLGGKITLNSTDYFTKVNATGSVLTNGGDLEVNSNHGFDIDNGGTVDLVSGDATILTPLVQLGDDIETTGTITGTASTVYVENPDAEIQDGVDVANAGAVVEIKNGTYAENIVIDKNLTISGESTAGTIITPASDTGSGGVANDASGLWLVEAGADADISNLTFDGAGYKVAEAIRFQGQGSVDNVAFKNIRYSQYIGLGIRAMGDGAVDVSNSTFENIERIGTFYASAGASGSTFSDNVFTGKGGVDPWINYGVEVGRGAGDIQILRNVITGNVGVATDGSTSAGVLVSTYYGAGSSAYLENNVFTDHTSAVAVGYDGADTSVVVARNNDFSGNENGVAFVGMGTADFSGNYWGYTVEADVADYMAGVNAEDVDFTPYLVSGVDTDGSTNGFQGDFSNLYATTLGNQTGATGRVQEGINFIADGSLTGGNRTLNLNAGEYVENGTTIDKAMMIDGVSSNATLVVIKGAGTGNGITLASDDISLRYLTVDGFANGIYTNSTIDNVFMRNVNSRNNANYGIEIHNSAVVDGLDLRNVRLTNNGSVGLRVSTEGSLNNLDMSGGLVSGSNIGIGFYKKNGDSSYVTDVNINGVTFTNNAQKAVYMEKLSDATFTNLDIRTSGTTGGNAAAGVDINLKYGDYQNISLIGTKVRTSATTAGGNAITVKARNDSPSYSGNPASLTGLTISGSDIETTGGFGIAVGNDVRTATLSGNTIVGGSQSGIDVYGGATSVRVTENNITNSATGVSVNNSPNIWVYDNDITGATFAGVHITDTNGSTYGNDADIWYNRINSAAGATGILVERSDYATVGAHLTNQPNADDALNGNVITGGDKGIVISDSDNAMVRYNSVSGTTSGNHHDGISVINGSLNTKVWDNVVSNVGWDGIYTANSTGTEILRNTVSGSDQVGISVLGGSVNTVVQDNTVFDSQRGILVKSGASGTTVSGNVVYDQTLDGIHVEGDGSLTVSGNYVGYTDKTVPTAGSNNNIAADGIYILNSDDAQITGNFVTEAGGNGIYNNSSDDTTISGNTISNIGLSGVLVNPSTGVDVIGNIIHTVSDDAIKILGGSGISVDSNFIGYSDAGTTVAGTDNITGDGVYVDASTGAEIKGNTITETHSTGADNGSGIQVVNTTGAVIGGAGADRNTITNSGWDGIRLQNNGSITVENNLIDTTARVGIWGGNIATASILDNIVKNDGLGGYGSIHADGGSNWTVTGNDVDGGDFGIYLRNTTGTNSISASNTVDNVTNDGIRADSVASLTIDGNFIGKNGGNVGGDGIEVQSSNGAILTNNEINDTDDNAIFVNASNDVEIGGVSDALGNDITRAGAHGILVTGGTSALIQYNTITGTNATSGADGVAGAVLDGIHVQSNSSVEVLNNTVQGGDARGRRIGPDYDGGNGANGYGILVNSSANADVIGNKVLGGDNHRGGDRGLGAGLDGVRVTSSSGSEINTNVINHVGGNGIYLNPSPNSFIDGNTISNTVLDGIRVISSNGVDITNNNLHAIGMNGIYAEGSNDLYIFTNTIGNGSSYGAQDDGIYVIGGHEAVIDNNTIQGADGNLLFLGAGRDGIHVVDNREAVISNNDIMGGASVTISTIFGPVTLPGGSGAGRYGIYADNSGAQGLLNDRNGVQITGNEILNDGLALGALSDGIHVNNSAGGLFGDRALIELNTVNGVGGNGIFVDNTSGAQVLTNTVSGTVQDGIHVEDSSLVEIIGNGVTGALGDGIELARATLGFDISQNTVSGSLRNGILATEVGLGTIDNNTVNGSGIDGISLVDGDGVAIDTNTVSLSGNNGISVVDSNLVGINTNTVSLSGNHGIFVDPSVGIDIIGNIVTLSAFDGINALDVLGLNIQDNFVFLSGDDGIDAQTVAGFDISGNVVGLSSDNGIELSEAAGGTVENNAVFLSGDDGIDVDDVALVGINGNLVALSGDDGIDVNNAVGFSVDNNAVIGSSDNGVEISNVALGSVDGNFVMLSADDGIEADDILGVSIDGNFVTLSGDDGIDVDDALFSSVNGNIVSLSGDNGIEVSDIAFSGINGNFVFLSGDDGIEADDILGVSIDGNTVLLSGDDGIDVDDALGFSVDGNTVIGSADNGIQLSDAAFGSVDNNFVMLSGDDGIDADDILGVSIDGNFVTLSGDDGIDVDDAALVSVDDNIVSLSANNGIEVSDVALASIDNNSVIFSGNDGINLDGAVLTAITDNFVMFSGGDGIDVEDTWLSYIGDNTVLFAADNGIEFQSGGLSIIDDNNVAFVGGNGIYVNPSYFMAITNNTIDFTGDDGIDINDGAFFLIANNEIGANGGFIGDDGIDVDGTNGVLIVGNTIQNADEAGIELTDTDLVNVLFNDISDNGEYGLWARGSGNGSVVLSGNTFTDNPVGARFESGQIDISGDANSFINTDPLATPVGLQFDEVGTPGSLTIVGNTLGSTIFSGFTNPGSFYVRIENGTLLDTVTNEPILINGLDASFDGFIPASVGGLLTLAQLNFIEDRLFDADDAVVNGRGQIFVGSTLALDVEEFFNQFGFYDAGFSGFNLTMLGLPPVTLPEGGLNNIQTFAGGPEDLNNINPAAGGPDDLNNIEPAAGNASSCWSDVVNASATGGVNFNFSGDPTESLNAAASCGS